MSKRRPPMGSDGRGASCHYCKRTLEATSSRSNVAATRDHYVARSMGGEYRVWSCWACNQVKGSMAPEEWRAYRDANPNWWRNVNRRQGQRSFFTFAELRR